MRCAEDELARFQDALLTLLSSGMSIDEIEHALRTDVSFDPFREYVATFEPRMIEVAVELLEKWGHRAAPVKSSAQMG